MEISDEEIQMHLTYLQIIRTHACIYNDLYFAWTLLICRRHGEEQIDWPKSHWPQTALFQITW